MAKVNIPNTKPSEIETILSRAFNAFLFIQVFETAHRRTIRKFKGNSLFRMFIDFSID